MCNFCLTKPLLPCIIHIHLHQHIFTSSIIFQYPYLFYESSPPFSLTYISVIFISFSQSSSLQLLSLFILVHPSLLFFPILAALPPHHAHLSSHSLFLQNLTAAPPPISILDHENFPSFPSPSPPSLPFHIIPSHPSTPVGKWSC